MMHLLEGAGQLNGAGYHSVATVLFRPIEDTFDCFAAVGLIEGAAGKWWNRELRPSDAAKMWVQAMSEEEFQFAYGVTTLAEYRKVLRSQFNEYSHCSPALTQLNLYYMPRNAKGGTMELNCDPQVIDANAHGIDAHLTTCLQEFIDMVARVFAEHFKNNIVTRSKLAALREEIDVILKRHQKHGCFDVLGAVELKRFEA